MHHLPPPAPQEKLATLNSELAELEEELRAAKKGGSTKDGKKPGAPEVSAAAATVFGAFTLLQCCSGRAVQNASSEGCCHEY